MATSKKKSDKPKASAKKTAPKKEEKTVEPEVKTKDKPEPAKKAASKKEPVVVTLSRQFGDLRATLQGLSDGMVKAPRKLRWALKTLDMAEEAVARAVKHSA